MVESLLTHFIHNLDFIEKYMDSNPEMVKDYVKMLKDLYEHELATL